jgi:large subunit ribosomal protein L22
MATTETRPNVRAVAKWVRITPRKARLVLEHIRGRTVPEARTVLAFTPRAAAREVEKVLRSAVANAEANHGLVGDELVVSRAFADDAIVLKRWRAQARGRVHRVRKRTSHITIELEAPEGARVIQRPVPAAPEPEPEPVAEETEEVEAEEAEAEEVAAEEVAAESVEADAEDLEIADEDEEPARRGRLSRRRRKAGEEGEDT